MYATIHSIVTNQINSKSGQIYFPFIFALFIFILINNLIGMVIRSLRIFSFNSDRGPVSGRVPGSLRGLFFYFTTTLHYNQFQCCHYSYHSTYAKNYNIKQYFTLASKSKTNYNLKGNNSYYLNPYYITGFADAEGCFTTSIYKDSRMSLK